ncbi:hypothetical protein PTKIN_Ptkin18bG0141900 [Pterospermum kingtungense]
MKMEKSSSFTASKHRLSAFFYLLFRFPLIFYHLLLVVAMQEHRNRPVVGKDENAVRQLITMISSDSRHVVEPALSALSTLAGDVSVAMRLMKWDIMQPIQSVLKSPASDKLVSVLQVVVKLAFVSDSVAKKMLNNDVIRSLKTLCTHKNPEVQRLALLSVGNLAFCLQNRRVLVTDESLKELLMSQTSTPEPLVNKAAARALAILGENEILRRAVKGKPVPKRGLRILSLDGGGMRGLATVLILKEIEKRTGKRMHELFDLICGTSTGGILAAGLGMRLMSIDRLEEIYRNLGELVFTRREPKDNESATWRAKLDQFYKTSSQSIRVVVHGSKHDSDRLEKVLQEMCVDEDGDLLIESAVKNAPKVFILSTLASVTPGQPFVFRNYQYPVGTPEVAISEGSGGVTIVGSPTTEAAIGYKRSASIGSCKHHLWQALRASCAAPYYLDEYSDGVYRWQDGALLANNPTIYSIREAQLLWPDTKIDCLVSVGSGTVPTKARKGSWRYLDAGQVLIESACSVERVEEALSTMLPMLPEIQYFRFSPVDERCDMELDVIDPPVFSKLEAAVNDYIKNNTEAFKSACDKLVQTLR